MSAREYSHGDCRTVEPDTGPGTYGTFIPPTNDGENMKPSTNTIDSIWQRGNRRLCSLQISCIYLLLMCFLLAFAITNSIRHITPIPMPIPVPTPVPTTVLTTVSTTVPTTVPTTVLTTVPHPVPVPMPVPIPVPVPWPGTTFIIRDRGSGKAITRKGNQVILDEIGNMGSQQWYYLETHGWVGFRNPNSGKYLGTDSHGKLIAKADNCNSWEQFDVRKHPDGGYVLLIRHFELRKEYMWYIGRGKGMDLVQVSDRERGIRWDFLET